MTVTMGPSICCRASWSATWARQGVARQRALVVHHRQANTSGADQQDLPVAIAHLIQEEDDEERDAGHHESGDDLPDHQQGSAATNGPTG